MKHQISSLFCGSFLPSWICIRIGNADPDPADKIKSGSGSRTLFLTLSTIYFRTVRCASSRKFFDLPLLFVALHSRGLSEASKAPPGKLDYLLFSYPQVKMAFLSLILSCTFLFEKYISPHVSYLKAC